MREKIYAVPIPAPHVVTRQGVLSKLHSLFFEQLHDTDFPVIAIVGNSAKGKTELAKQYAAQFRDQYHHIWFVQVEAWEVEYRKRARLWQLFNEGSPSGATISIGVLNVADSGSVVFQSAPGQQLPIDKHDIIYAVHKVFSETQHQGSKKSLIIFDNATSKFFGDVLQGQLPSNTDVLVTTQDSADWEVLVDLSLEEYQLSGEEGLAILKDWVPKDRYDPHLAKEIVQRFANLPVVIAQAGRFLSKSRVVQMKGYIEEFERNKKEVLSQGKLKKPHDIGYIDIYTSVVMTMQDIVKIEPQSLKLLKYCSFLPGKEIPIELLLGLFGSNSLLLQGLLNILDTLIVSDEEKVTIHDFFQDVVSTETSFDEQSGLLIGIADTSDAHEEFLLTNPEKMAVIYSEAIRFLESKEQLTKEEKKKIERFFKKRGLAQKQEGLYAKAADSYKKALSYHQDKEVYEAPTRETSWLCRQICSALRALYQVEEAIGYAERALSIDQELDQVNGPNPSTIQSFRMAAWALSPTERQKTLGYLLRAHKTSVSLLTRRDPDFVRTYQDLGWTLEEMANHQNDLDELMKVDFFQNALGDLEKSLELSTDEANNFKKACLAVDLSPEELPDCKDKLYHLALACYKKALVIDVMNDNQESSNIAKSYCNLGRLLGDLGKFQAAIKCHRKGKQLRKRLFGSKHPEVAKCYSNIAWNLNKLADVSKALAYYRKSLDIRTKTLGIGHRHTLQTIEDIKALQGDK